MSRCKLENCQMSRCKLENWFIESLQAGELVN